MHGSTQASSIFALLTAFLLAQEPRAGGILARFAQKDRSDTIVLPNPALFVPAQKPPTSLLGAGDYSIQLEGFIHVDLRSQYSFQVEASGEAEVLVNGHTVLRLNGEGWSELSPAVRLNRGPNFILVKMEAKNATDTQFRLFWKARNGALAIPVPSASLSYASDDPRLREGRLLRTGAAALAKYRCTRCHEPERRTWPGSEMDSPDLTHVGARLRGEWMAEWIANPRKAWPAAQMPKLVSEEEANEIAGYLSSLGTEPAANERGSVVAGEQLYADLQCGKCHGSDDSAARRLDHVARKFYLGALQRYLLDPQEHYRWNRMPNFKLNPQEAADLAAFLVKDGVPVEPALGSGEKGKALMESKGCLTCHNAPAQPTFRAMPLAAIRTNLNAGCLNPDDLTTPRFHLTGEERAGLIAILKGPQFDHFRTGSTMEFALNQIVTLGCGRCHDAPDGVIRMDLLGGKFRPEWVAQFLKGEVTDKPRPWRAARMPAFALHANELAEGLAAMHGVPPRTEAEKPIDPKKADLGAKLISAASGFSCVACHAVGTSNSATIVESPGVNLALAGERLLKPFFHRWVMNPLALDPATRMPVYFDEKGRSQRIEIFEGDGTRQIEAMWEYLRLGRQMPPPPAP